ncbi:hypothetical protein Glove_187g151 [Diversispora epigaea]|uniref:Uncharacterized protein n=1 Tax=Diversispora epigaea TaxID=1348612 RepID=A0A397IRL8_9GLOM|nr:hypothetical protein Glove_187g151 [Diversispora epigaea]
MEKLSSIYRPDLSQRIIEIFKLTLWSRHLKTQQASPSTTSETTPRQRRRSNETSQSFLQAVSLKRSPEQVTSCITTSPNNWDQLRNIQTFYQPLDFNLLN